jgi:hypothetical protein
MLNKRFKLHCGRGFFLAFLSPQGRNIDQKASITFCKRSVIKEFRNKGDEHFSKPYSTV